MQFDIPALNPRVSTRASVRVSAGRDFVLIGLFTAAGGSQGGAQSQVRTAREEPRLVPGGHRLRPARPERRLQGMAARPAGWRPPASAPTQGCGPETLFSGEMCVSIVNLKNPLACILTDCVSANVKVGM